MHHFILNWHLKNKILTLIIDNDNTTNIKITIKILEFLMNMLIIIINYNIYLNIIIKYINNIFDIYDKNYNKASIIAKKSWKKYRSLSIY